MKRQNWLILGLVGGGVVLLALLPWFFAAPHMKDENFPYSGEILGLTDQGFVLGGPRQGKELTIVLNASTTIRGELAVGEFVQAFGDMNEPGTIVAKRVRVIDGPRKKDHD